MNKLKFLLAAALLAVTSQAQAGFITVDISSIVNSNLTSSYTNGGFYPGPGPISIGGTPFQLAAFPGTGDTGVVGGLVSAAAVYTLGGLNISGASAMYAIINSAFGACGTPVGEIGVAGANFNLTEGTNVRDHFQGNFCNVQTDAVATASYGGGVLFDVYRFDLSGAVDPITSLRFENYGAGGAGSPFLAAVTFEVPEPGALGLLGLGLFGLGLSRRRQLRT